MKRYIAMFLSCTMLCSTLTGCAASKITSKLPEPMQQLIPGAEDEAVSEALNIATETTAVSEPAAPTDTDATPTDITTEETSVPEEPAGPQPGIVMAENSRDALKQNGASSQSGTASSQNGTTTVQQNGKYTVDDVINALDPKGYKITSSAENYKQIAAVDQSGDVDKFYFITEVNVKGGTNQGAIYGIGNDIYCYVGSNNNKYLMYHINGTADDLMNTGTSTFTENENFPNKDNILSVNTIGTEEYQGTTYDKVEVVIKSSDYDEYQEMLDSDVSGTITVDGVEQDLRDSYRQNMQNTSIYYFNPETGKVEYIKSQSNGQEAMMHIEPFSPIEREKWFDDCKDASEDEAMSAIFAIGFLIMSDELITEDAVNNADTTSIFGS